MIYTVRHLTALDYGATVRLARFNLRLKPASWAGQRLIDYSLVVDPVPGAITWDDGPWVARRARLTIREPIARLSIESRFTVDVAEPSFLTEAVAAPAVAQVRELALLQQSLTATGPAAYLYASPMIAIVPEIARWSAPFFNGQTSALEAGRHLMAAIHRDFTYDSRATASDTTPAQAFAKRRGVCQDFAHVMIAAARAHGIPAAYVSGYLRTEPPPGRPRLVGADAMHAWACLWCGIEHGWIGFDPTNSILAGSDHIFVAMGRDYSDVAPLDGVFHGGSAQKMRVAVDVIPAE